MSLYAIGDLRLHFQSELKAPGQLQPLYHIPALSAYISLTKLQFSMQLSAKNFNSGRDFSL